MSKPLSWLKEYSGGILALMAIIGSIFGSTAYIVGELRAVDQRLTASDAQLREEIRSGDAQLREEIRSGDAQLREDIRSLEAKMVASDAQLREEIRAGDAELRLALENLSNRILDILANSTSTPTKYVSPSSSSGG